jgi:PPOX class probable F420-dependent enzyme
MTIPPQLQSASYISLGTFRRSGVAVRTPVWFAEQGGRLYVMSRPDSGKNKRIRNNPQVTVAPCDMRGRVHGPEFSGSARILPAEAWPGARQLIRDKYWMARIPFIWGKDNTYLEIALG